MRTWGWLGLAACGAELPLQVGPDCGEGMLAVEGRCVPERCGSERWRLPKRADGVVHVDAEAPAGGDGSRERPMREITEAFDLVAGEEGRQVIVVAAGEYEASVLRYGGEGPQTLVVAGRCPELTRVRAAVPADVAFGSWQLEQASDQHVELSGIALWGSEARAALAIAGGSAAIEDVVISGAAGLGVMVDSEATVVMERVRVGDAAEAPGAAPAAAGISVLGEATLEVRDSELRGNRGAGLFAWNATVDLIDTLIVDGLPPPSGTSGLGVTAQEGASVRLEGCLVQGNRGYGVQASGLGTTVALDGTEVSGQRLDEEGVGGGLAATDGGTISLAGGSSSRDNEGPGALVLRASLLLADAEVSGNLTLPEGVLPGYGVVLHASELNFRHTTFAENHGAGVAALGRLQGDEAERGSLVVGIDSEIVDTRFLAVDQPGHGLASGPGDVVELTNVSVRGNHGAGVFVYGPEAPGGSATSLRMTGGSVSGTRGDPASLRGTGIEVQRAQAWLTDVVVEDNSDIGVMGSGVGTELYLERVRVIGNVRGGQPHAYGVRAEAGTRLVVHDSEVVDGVGYGVVVVGRGGDGVASTALLEDVRIAWGDGLAALAALVVLEGAEVDARRVQIEGAGESGVVVSEARLVASDLVVLDTRRTSRIANAAALFAFEGGVVEATGASVHGVQGAAFLALDGSLTCTDCTSSATERAAAVLQSGTLDLRGGLLGSSVTVGGRSVGVLAERSEVQARSLRLDGVTVEPHTHSAVLLLGPGDYAISNSTLSGGPGYPPFSGVLADGHDVHGNALAARGLGEAAVVVSHSTLRASRVALFLAEAGAALDEVGFADNVRDIVQQGCAGSAAEVTGTFTAASVHTCAMASSQPGERFEEVSFGFFFDLPELEAYLGLAP